MRALDEEYVTVAEAATLLHVAPFGGHGSNSAARQRDSGSPWRQAICSRVFHHQ